MAAACQAEPARIGAVGAPSHDIGGTVTAEVDLAVAVVSRYQRITVAILTFDRIGIGMAATFVFAGAVTRAVVDSTGIPAAELAVADVAHCLARIRICHDIRVGVDRPPTLPDAVVAVAAGAVKAR